MRVEGELGQLDTVRCLQFLTYLSQIVEAVLPEGASLPLHGLHAGSAVLIAEPVGASETDVIELIEREFSRPDHLTRDLRSEIVRLYDDRASFGIRSASIAAQGRVIIYDAEVQRSFTTSLRRPTVWTELVGELRGLAKNSRGLSGRIRSSTDHRSVPYEAGPAMEDALKPLLFQRASLSGLAEVDDRGQPTRMVVEHARRLGEYARLSDFDPGDASLDIQQTHAALRQLRGG